MDEITVLAKKGTLKSVISDFIFHCTSATPPSLSLDPLEHPPSHDLHQTAVFSINFIIDFT